MLANREKNSKKIGVKIIIKKMKFRLFKKIKSLNLRIAPYPGFPTDLQAKIMVLLCKANKRSFIYEDIFENRFMHVAELNRMGAKFQSMGIGFQLRVILILNLLN